jgi:Domain of unknown function (DUF1707)
MLLGMGRDEMRAGDSDREAVASKLKSALDEGRLDLHEYDERLQKTYTAKTYGDLNGLLDDLPGTLPPQRSQVQGYEPPVSSPVQALDPAAQRSGGEQMARWIGPYAGVILISTVIWAITSIAAHDLLYYWPVWMLIPLVFGMWGRWWSRSNGSGDSDRDARRAARRERRGR